MSLESSAKDWIEGRAELSPQSAEIGRIMAFAQELAGRS